MSAMMPSDDESKQKQCDECGYGFDPLLVAKCNRCHIVNVCSHCASPSPKAGSDSGYDMCCKKCWTK